MRVQPLRGFRVEGRWVSVHKDPYTLPKQASVSCAYLPLFEFTKQQNQFQLFSLLLVPLVYAQVTLVGVTLLSERVIERFVENPTTKRRLSEKFLRNQSMYLSSGVPLNDRRDVISGSSFLVIEISLQLMLLLRDRIRLPQCH